MALGLSFLEAAYFFGGEFREECFTGPNKTRQKHDRKLIHFNGAGCKMAMEELLTTKEGIAGQFYMDVNILSTVYKYMANQLHFMGEFPWGKHMTTKAWNKAYKKAVDEMVDKIGQQIFCQKRKMGWAYPVCLREPGYLDHAYPLPVDDPQYRPPGPYHENWADTMADESGEAQAVGGGGPDVVIEEEYEEEITTIYDSANDPTAACHRTDPTPVESLADILQSSVERPGPSEKQRTCRSRSRGESENLSTDSEMKEAMGELSLSAQMSEWLGPAPDALPNLSEHATDLGYSRRSEQTDGLTAIVIDSIKPGRDTAKYERQKGELERHSHPKNKRASSQAGQSDAKRRSRSHSRPRVPTPEPSLPSADASPQEKVKLHWIPGEQDDYPVHFAEKKMDRFTDWAEKFKLDVRCDEVRALQFIEDFQTVAGKIVASVHWGLVFGILKLKHPVPCQVVGLEAIRREMQSPPESLFPIRYVQNEDLRVRAWDEWENIASWAQYWFDALQAARHPGLLFGGDARLVSPLVLFIFHHINWVLELPIRMKEILANTGWAVVWENMEKLDEGRLNEKLEEEKAETRSVMNQNRWNDTAMEVTARQNFELLKTRVREAQKHRDAAAHRQLLQDDGEGRRQYEMKPYERRKKHRETDMERDRRHRRSDKEHEAQARAAKARADKPPALSSTQGEDSDHQDACQGRPEGTETRVCRTPSPEETPSHEEPTPPSSAPASSDAQSLSPTEASKDAGDLDESSCTDPITEMCMHYLPDPGEPSILTEPASEDMYDPRDIEDMEADYTGQHSTREERHQGQYGGPQLYHIVPSPRRIGVEDEEELSGIAAEADASPSTEARLLAESPKSETPQKKSVPPRPSTPVPLGGLSLDEPEVEGDKAMNA